MKFRLALVATALATASLFTRAHAAESPGAVFAAYERLANAGDLDGLKPLVSKKIGRPPMTRCPPSQSDYDCFFNYVGQTVFSTHSMLKSTHVEEKGDTVFADLLLSNDLTRAAGVDRIKGVDRVTVQDGKIVDFAFVRDENDPQTMHFFQYMASTMRH